MRGYNICPGLLATKIRGVGANVIVAAVEAHTGTEQQLDFCGGTFPNSDLQAPLVLDSGLCDYPPWGSVGGKVCEKVSLV